MDPGARRCAADTHRDRGPTAGEDGSEVGYVGIGGPTNDIRYGPLEALPRSLAETGAKTAMMLRHLKKMVVGDVSVKNLAGPLTIAKVAGDSAQAGWRFMLGYWRC